MFGAENTLASLMQAKAEQEQFAEIARSEQILDIRAKLADLGNEEQHRLLLGLIDGHILITPPRDDAEKPKGIFGWKKWVRFKLRPNIPILLDICGVKNTCDNGESSVTRHLRKR